MILRKWEKENNNEYYCTKCGETFIIDYIGFSNYVNCPHCGETQQWKYIKRSASEVAYIKFISKEEDGSHFIITKIKKIQYYKVDKKYKRVSYGTGLGLSIVKNILINHKFNYGVETSKGKGTKFYFDIKIEKK